MRFGKKLALQVMEDSSGAPYLSHKPMKEAINRTVRELRLYQARVQSLQCGGGEQMPSGGAGPNDANGAASPAELGDRIRELDRQLFVVVDDDLQRILAYVRQSEMRLSAGLAQLQEKAMDAGILVQEAQLERLEKALPNAPQDRSVLTERLLQLQMKSNPAKMAADLEGLGVDCNTLIESANQHAQYLEINVAGFRKLLKRHEKQIPQEFRSRNIPSLGFHKLVTHTSRQLLNLVRQVSSVIVDGQERMEKVASPDVLSRALEGRTWTKLVEQKGLGPECEMVLSIQKRLKNPVHSQLVTDPNSSGGSQGATMHLYPKPFSASGFPASKMGGNNQQPNQQPNQQLMQQGDLQQGYASHDASVVGPYAAVPMHGWYYNAAGSTPPQDSNVPYW